MDKTVKFNIKVVSNGKSAFHEIEVSAEDFRNVVKKANDEIKNSAKALDNLAKSGMAFSAAKDAIDAIQSAIGGLADEYNRFDKAMRSVNTMAGLGADDFDKLTASVEKLATQIPLAKEELANGLYQVISNGVPEDNWIEYLNASARSAVGGIADLGEVVTVTSTIIKNYGLSWDAAQMIQDKIQTTAKNGVTSFEQLAAALPRVSGNAATLGVGIDELMASFATLTGVSGNTAEVSTQLAAIFSALVKPSSEAAKMAEQMGVRFDAAAIKAAGGMKNFLSQLSKDISRYAAQANTLEQEIYGKLFGSAESIRALIPLTGELADKFAENIDAMKGSAGTMDDAFQTMAGSGEAAMQMLKNSISNMTSFAGSIASAVQPTLSFVSALGQSIAGVSMLNKTITTLMVESGKIPAITSLVTKLRVALFGAAKGAITLKQAIRGALISTGIGAAIFAITMAVELLIKSLSSAGDEMGRLSVASEQLKQSTDAYNQASANAKSAIDMEIAKLKQLIDNHADDKKAVDEMNQKYGESFGTYKTAAQWYDVLTQKSAAYCQAIGYEAQAQEIATQKAQNKLRLLELQGRMEAMKEAGTVKETRFNTMNTSAGAMISGTYEVETAAYRQLREEAEQLEEAQGSLTKKFDQCTAAMADARKEIGDLSNGVKTLAEGDKKIELPVKLNGLDETKIKARLQQVQAAIDAAPTLEKKLELQPEKQQLQKQLKQVQETIENHSFQLRFEASKAGKINLNTEKIAPSVTIETGRITQMAEEAKGQMQDIFNKPIKVKVNDNDMKGFDERTRSAYESVGQLGSSLSQLGSSIGLPALDIMGVIAQAIANVALSYSQALAGAASMGPWAWIAFAAYPLWY